MREGRDHVGRRWAAVALLASLSCQLGCASLFKVKGPGARGSARERSDCTASYTAPVIDTVAGALPAALLVGLLAANSSDPEGRKNRGPAVAGAAVFTALAAASATYGYVQVHRCREARGDQALRLALPFASLDRPARPRLSRPSPDPATAPSRE
jgi:hypothetical protein